MSRICFFLLLTCFLTNSSLAQNDSLNQVKYWKFRNNFVEKFIKIGPNQGESLPAGALIPKGCIDNIASDGTDPSRYQYTDYGEIHWGDGMIRHGHYLALLATEYALKKKYKQDLKGTLNELYYAIYAINRLDMNAETELSIDYKFYDSTLDMRFKNELNGFYLREDIPEDFCLNWKDEQMNFACTNSAFYENNNVGKIYNREHNYYVKERTSYQNVPSMDQMSSLIVGLALIDKLLDDVYVKPKPSDQGFKIVSEAKAIVERIVRFASDRNWELIDVNGWPVPNGGGDLAFGAYPYAKAATRITGNSYSDHFYRKRLKYHPKWFEIQHCITGYGTLRGPDEQSKACEYIKMSILKPGMKRMYKKLLPGTVPGPLNNQNQSVYLDWNSSGYYHSINLSKFIWENNSINFSTKFFQKFKDEPVEAGLRSMEGVSSFNQAIVFNLGVTAGHWNSNLAHYFGNKTENRQLELTNSILYDLEPAASKAFYQSYLDGMPVTGPYNIIGKNWTPNPEGPWYAEYLCAGNGWGADFRWTEPDQAFGDDGKEGVYSALDYMLFHNLYYLTYSDELPVFKQEFNCFCEEGLSVPVGKDITDEEKIEALNELNNKLKYVPTCQENVFEPIYNLVTGVFDVKPLFADYPELGIATARYQTMDARVKPGGRLNIQSNLIVYSNKTLQVDLGGKVRTTSGDVILNDQAKIDLIGEFRIGAGTSLIIDSQSKLILHQNARLIIEEGGQLILEDDGVLEMYNGAEVITEGENVELILKGSIIMLEGGIFTVTPGMR